MTIYAIDQYIIVTRVYPDSSTADIGLHERTVTIGIVRITLY